MTASQRRPPRIPPRWLFHAGWALHRAVYALSGGRLGLRPAGEEQLGTLRLRTLGRRSGRERATMLYYLEDGPSLAVVASNAGADVPPAWWLNLRAAPEADVDLASGPRGVLARAASVEEQRRLWPRFVACLAQYADYEAATKRSIPIVILEPLAEAGEEESVAGA